ncbi:hypothetical protein GCM10008119_25100 [Pedobacter mendelii]|uniref:Right handed beta helix domain-containing protein n=2 Tax=Pedobacter mendelii TaxID=1908240 RepID=A0ABQ2BK03_9SPHI|nr:hypothetical protein GCM10008119_25100 [Pedobacter mendelii]
MSDDTGGLQKLILDSTNIYLKAGVYIINQTLRFKASTKIYGENGTVIKAGKEMKGDLLEHGRYILVEKSDNSLIRNITFSQSENLYKFKEWANSCIFVLNTRNFTVQNCIFNFHLSYQSLGMEAVWISGIASKNNIIKANEINTLSIRYAEDGADSTTVESNVINKSYSNALTSTGNHISDFISGCKVLNNKVLNAGRMGIEDWGNTEGTIIRGNSISGTGKDPKQAMDGIALSAVGKNTTVSNNIITDGKIYGIEVRGNYGVNVTGNQIYTASNTTGIILNFTFLPPEANLPQAIVDNNKITDAFIGLHIFGDYEAKVTINKNSFINNASKSISIESGAKNFLITSKNNNFSFSVPNTQDRFALFSYTKFEPGNAHQQLIMNTDTINFLPSSAAGKGVDFGVVIRTDNTRLEKIRINAHFSKNSNNIPVNAITAFGAKPNGLQLYNNFVSGGIVDLNGFVNPKLLDNNFVQ